MRVRATVGELGSRSHGMTYLGGAIFVVDERGLAWTGGGLGPAPPDLPENDLRGADGAPILRERELPGPSRVTAGEPHRTNCRRAPPYQPPPSQVFRRDPVQKILENTLGRGTASHSARFYNILQYFADSAHPAHSANYAEFVRILRGSGRFRRIHQFLQDSVGSAGFCRFSRIEQDSVGFIGFDSIRLIPQHSATFSRIQHILQDSTVPVTSCNIRQRPATPQSPDRRGGKGASRMTMRASRSSDSPSSRSLAQHPFLTAVHDCHVFGRVIRARWRVFCRGFGRGFLSRLNGLAGVATSRSSVRAECRRFTARSLFSFIWP